MRSTRHTRTWSAVAGAVLGLVALAACGGGSEGGSLSEPAAGIADGEVTSDHGGAFEEKAAAPGTGRDPGTANRPFVQTRAVIRTGEIYLVTREMNRARDEIDRLLARHGGYLATEDTVNDRDGRPERSALVLRVP